MGKSFYWYSLNNDFKSGVTVQPLEIQSCFHTGQVTRCFNNLSRHMQLLIRHVSIETDNDKLNFVFHFNRPFFS